MTTTLNWINYSPNFSTENGLIPQYKDRFNLNLDKDWSARQCKLFIFKLFLEGKIYDNLQSWWEEYNGEEYIPLARRKPSIIYRLPLIIVDDSVAMLYGEGHFPIARCDDENIELFLDSISKLCNLQSVMMASAKIGSLGSTCIIIKILNGKFFFDVLSTIFLEPIFDKNNPDELISLTERKKIHGEVLKTKGYKIDKDHLKEDFWLIREWTTTHEIHYMPMRASEVKDSDDRGPIDEELTVEHGLGFVPAVWIKNSYDSVNVDGICTFEPILSQCIEIDYQLSQLGRMLKYNSDPTLVIKECSSLRDQQLMKGVGTLQLENDGEAYLLEMKNAATNAVIDYVRCLREFGLESVRGNRANPDKLSALHSGKALQMLNSPLISLVSELRICYGDLGLLKLYKMLLRIIQSDLYELRYQEIKVSKNWEETLRLDWPDWYPPTPDDCAQEALSLSTLRKSKLLSQETAIESIGDRFKINDISAEIKKIDNETQSEMESMENSANNQKINIKTTKKED